MKECRQVSEGTSHQVQVNRKLRRKQTLIRAAPKLYWIETGDMVHVTYRHKADYVYSET